MAQAYGVLYSFAEKLENPSFVGWTVESDFFFQVEQAVNQRVQIALRGISTHSKAVLPIALYDWKHTKNKNLVEVAVHQKTKKRAQNAALEQIKQIAVTMIPSKRNEAIACKPKTWNQGGYDVFFVEFKTRDTDGKTHINLRFMQITKGAGHDLKAEYLHSVILFFIQAGYVINSVEIAFVLTPDNASTFRLGSVTGNMFLTQFRVFGCAKMWTTKVDETNIAKYELKPSKTHT